MQGETIGRETIGRETMEENLLGDLKPSKPFPLETTSGKNPLFRSPPLWWPDESNLVHKDRYRLKLQG